MIREPELLSQCRRLEAQVLHAWIDEGLLSPHRDDTGLLFDDIDQARVALIVDLHYGMGLEHASLPVILSLIDQLHRTRHSLRAICAALAEESDEVHASVVSRVAVMLRPATKG